MNRTGKKVFAIVIFFFLIVCAILSFINSVKTLGDYADLVELLGSTNDIILYGRAIAILGLIDAIIVFILLSIGVIITLKDEFERPSMNLLIAAFMTDAIFGFIGGLVAGDLVHQMGFKLTAEAVLVIVFAGVAALILLVSLFIREERPAEIVASAGILILFIFVIISMSNSKPEGIGLVYDIFYMIGSLGSIGMLMTFAIIGDSYRYRYQHNGNYRAPYSASYKLGDMVYNSVDLYDEEGHKIPANSSVLIISKKPDGTYRISHRHDSLGTLYVESVRGSSLTRIKSVDNYQTEERVEPRPAPRAVAREPRPAVIENPVAKLRELKELKDEGIITEEEYQEKRQKYVDKL